MIESNRGVRVMGGGERGEIKKRERGANRESGRKEWKRESDRVGQDRKQREGSCLFLGPNPLISPGCAEPCVERHTITDKTSGPQTCLSTPTRSCDSTCSLQSALPIVQVLLQLINTPLGVVVLQVF